MYTLWWICGLLKGIPIIKARRSPDRLVFVMRICLLIRPRLCTKTTPGVHETLPDNDTEHVEMKISTYQFKCQYGFYVAGYHFYYIHLKENAGICREFLSNSALRSVISDTLAVCTHYSMSNEQSICQQMKWCKTAVEILSQMSSYIPRKRTTCSVYLLRIYKNIRVETTIKLHVKASRCFLWTWILCIVGNII